jgi:hypothetical protein
MKNKFYTFVALLAVTFTGIIPAIGQKAGSITDTVLMGAGYNNEVYYSMSAGTKGAVNRKQWDIAFRASRMSASILTNDAANNNAIFLTGVELYAYPKSDTSGWATIDTSGLYTWKNMVNSTTDWETGAFDQNQLGHPDYGWGKYNTASHNVVGDSLFIIKLRDGSLRKLWIVEKYSSENIFQFRFANIDGSDDTTVMLDCNPYSTKNFVGYSIITKEIVDFEPVASDQWDILFAKYMYTYPEDGVLYPVTGVLSNYNTKVNKFEPVAPDYRLWDLETMDSTRSPIGWEWKYLDAEFIYHVVDSLVYFVQDQGGNIHKLVFTEFAGSSTGRIVLQKEMISAAGIGEIEKTDLNAVVYPNPVNDVMNIVINPGKEDQVLISVLDVNGRTVLNRSVDLPSETLTTLRIPAGNLVAGIYIVRMQIGTNIISRKIVVNN